MGLYYHSIKKFSEILQRMNRSDVGTYQWLCNIGYVAKKYELLY